MTQRSARGAAGALVGACLLGLLGVGPAVGAAFFQSPVVSRDLGVLGSSGATGVVQAMAGWVERSGGDFSAFLPNDQWHFVASQSGVDISSPAGDADASFGYVYNDPSPVTDAQVLSWLLNNLGYSAVHVLRQSRVYTLAGGQRQTTELVGTQNGVAVQSVVTVDVYNNPALASYGYDVYLQQADADAWTQYAATLALIVNHITVYGQTPSSSGP